MTNAGQGLPPRPLVGTTLVASAEQVVAQDAPEPEEKPKKPDAFQRILNGLFGG